MLDKKADIKNLGQIILALVILIAIILFLKDYILFLTQSGGKEACKNWVNLQSIPVLKEVKTFESSCITTEEIIKNKDVKTRNDLYKILANSMYDCWDMYGRGESYFYKNFFVGDTYCRVCSEIKADSSLDQDKRNIDLDEFELYLTNNHPPGHRETYAEFFTKTKNANLDFGSGTLTLDEEKKIYTTFTIYATDLNLKGVGTHASFAGGACVAIGGTVAIAAASTGILAPAALPLGGVGCAIGFIGGAFVSGLTGSALTYYPSITLFQSTSDQIMNTCDSIYYKPQQK